MRRWALIVLIVAALAAKADEVDPPLENHWYGTRSGAMGGAAIVSAQGVEALFANPGGCVRKPGIQACAGLLELPYQRRALWAGAVFSRGTWGLTMAWGATSVGDIAFRDQLGTQTGTGSWQRHRISVGYARALDFLTYVGGAVRLICAEGAGMSARGCGVDIGVVKRILPPLLAVGGAVNDAFTWVAYDGGAERRETIRPRFTGGIGIGLAEGKIRLEWDLYKRLGWKTWHALIGVEAKVGHGLVARVGYGATGVTAGVGLSSGGTGVGLAAIPDELGSSSYGVEAIWTR